MATIPLDARVASPEVAAFFRGEHAPLSLVVHGNDHLGRELGRSISDDEALTLAAQALRRIDQLERQLSFRWHGSWCRLTAHCPRGSRVRCYGRATRPCVESSVSVAGASTSRPALAGWESPRSSWEACPLIPRFRLADRDDLPLRAFLGQPLVLYGHSEDLADGYDVLAEAAEDVDALGDVNWVSPRAIAQTNYAVLEEGETVGLRLFSRSARVRLPAGTRWLSVELPASADGLEHVAVSADEGRGKLVALGEAVDVAGHRVIDVRLTRRDAISPLLVPRPRRSPWPILRRTLTEARDRSLPRLPPRARVLLRRSAAGHDVS